jgi:hypothetical protein
MAEKLTGPCYNLFLDDKLVARETFTHTQNPIYVDKRWHSVSSYQEFVDYISKMYSENKLPAIVSFDHDLGDGSDSARHCVKWLIDFCIDTDSPLPECLVHSNNPVGKENIESMLKSFKCEYCGGEGYHKMSCYKKTNHTV